MKVGSGRDLASSVHRSASERIGASSRIEVFHIKRSDGGPPKSRFFFEESSAKKIPIEGRDIAAKKPLLCTAVIYDYIQHKFL